MPSRITIDDANLVSSELRFTASGDAVISIRIAVNKRIKNKQTGEFENGDATFLTCTAWKQRAERIAEENIAPGEAIFASGLFEAKPYEKKDGTKGISNEVSLDAFGRDYKWLSKDKKQGNKTGTTVKEDYNDTVPF
jgi:single-strand DNA-binding protein